MLGKPTTFILGAGASMPYGFPSGRALLMTICRELTTHDSNLERLLLQCGHEHHELQAFASAPAQSRLPSVDLFLEHRPEFMTLGKQSIAAILVPLEDEARLRGPQEMTWFDYLLNEMMTERDAFGSNPATFITFNYDRSLEQLFYSSLTNCFGLNGSEWARIMADIRIVHLHGQLGGFPY